MRMLKKWSVTFSRILNQSRTVVLKGMGEDFVLQGTFAINIG